MIQVPMNEVFRGANATRKRYRILKGSAGSGKSVNTALDFILKLSDERFKGANLLVVRKIEESNRDSTFSELFSAVRRIFGERAPEFWSARTTPLSMRCRTTGNAILFRGMNDANQREKMKSISFAQGKLTWIWVEEATELSESDIDLLDDRLRGELDNENLYYQMTLTFNPVSASHWIKRKFFDFENPDVFICHSTYRDNRFIDEAFRRRMILRREQDPEGYRVYGLGEWGETGGLILQNYTVREFDVSTARFDKKVYAQDFGFNHANCILDLGFYDSGLYVCGEIYEFSKDTSELIEIALRRGLSKHVVMWCDSAEPDRIRMWKKAGFRARPVKKEPGSVKAQIDYLKQLKIHIHPQCKNTIAEISRWRWQTSGKSGQYLDEPEPGFDDAMACLRYGVEEYRRGGMVTF